MPKYYIYMPQVYNIEKIVKELIDLAINKNINKDNKIEIEYNLLQLNPSILFNIYFKSDNMIGSTRLFLDIILVKETTKLVTITVNGDAVRQLKKGNYELRYI